MQRYILTSFKKEILYLHLDLCIPIGQIWYKSQEHYLSHIKYNWQKIHCYRLTKFCYEILNDIFRFQLVHFYIDSTYLFGKNITFVFYCSFEEIITDAKKCIIFYIPRLPFLFCQKIYDPSIFLCSVLNKRIHSLLQIII